MGLCLDAILYDGVLRVNDILIIGGLEKPLITKVKGIFEPKVMADMRDRKTKFASIREAAAATGVRITAPELDGAIAGMPIISSPQGTSESDIEKLKLEVQKEVDEVIIETDKEGIVIKADTIGSLEAIVKLLKDKGIKIRKASVGNITKKDVADAESNYDKDPTESVILGFNVVEDAGLKKERVKIIISNIIYRLIDDHESWKTEEKKKIEQRDLEGLTRPCKIEYLRNYTFRASNPAIIGIEVLEGKLRAGIDIMKDDGEQLANVKEIQENKEAVTELEKKQQGAISLPGLSVGRQINEGDIFYSSIPEKDFRKLKTLTKYMSREETSLIKEIAEIMRKKNPVWGI